MSVASNPNECQRRSEVKTKLLLSVSLVVLLSGMVGSVRAAEGTHGMIPFPFVVERITLPAGEYDFVPSPDQQVIRVTATGKGQSGVAIVVTRLAAGIHTTPDNAHIVFDKIGETYIFSELWLPEVDGFLVHATKEKHEHKIMNVPA
jgi:hypothetical protein